MINTKLLLLSLSSSTLLFFTACGGGGSTSEENPPTNASTESTSVTVPQKINIDIPDGLKATRNANVNNQTSFQKTEATIPSYGYQNLKSSIQEAEERIRDIRHNIVYLNSMMNDIVAKCTTVSINTQCTIPAGTISLNITEDINKEIANIDQEFNTINNEETIPVGTTLTLGQVLYTKFDNNHTYQNHVVLDLQPTFSNLGLEVTKLLETVKWSDDNNSVQTISDVNEEYGNYKMQLVYVKDPNSGIENMTIIDSFDETESSFSGNYSLSLKNSNDVNNTFEVNTKGEFLDMGFKTSFNSKGEISDNGGFLNSNGSWSEDSQYAEKETFDKNGNVLKSLFCDSLSDSCNLSDESTWHTFDENFGIDFDYDDNQTFYDDFNETFVSDDSNMFFIKDLVVTGGTIPEGMCDLLPPSFDTKNLEDINLIQENTIGVIFNYDDEEPSGTLYNSSYTDQLETLKVVCVEGLELKYKELTGDDRPTLTLGDDTID